MLYRLYARSYLPPAPQTLVDLFNVARSNAKTMSSVFLVYGKERMTFAQVFAAVDALAAALVTKFNVKRGDRFVLLTFRHFYLCKHVSLSYSLMQSCYCNAEFAGTGRCVHGHRVHRCDRGASERLVDRARV